MPGDDGGQRSGGDAEAGWTAFLGDRSALSVLRRPVKGHFIDAFIGDGAVYELPWGRGVIMGHDLTSDVGQ